VNPQVNYLTLQIRTSPCIIPVALAHIDDINIAGFYDGDGTTYTTLGVLGASLIVASDIGGDNIVGRYDDASGMLGISISL